MVLRFVSIVLFSCLGFGIIKCEWLKVGLLRLLIVVVYGINCMEDVVMRGIEIFRWFG